MVDIILGATLLILLSPVMLVVGALIWAKMGWPVIYLQSRAGLGGTPFRMVKFRTMDADRRGNDSIASYQGPERRLNHKSGHDPRHTGLGMFMRKWSLDELPQLIQIVSGRMTLVGPRPELMSVVDGYEPWQHDRHVVKPGLTGTWQVTKRGELPLHEATSLDIEYTKHITARTDTVLILKTIPAVLRRRAGS